MNPAEAELCTALHLMSIPVELPRKLCEVRESDTRGRGLFAVGDIPKGSVVTQYPADLVRVEVGPGEGAGERQFVAMRLTPGGIGAITRSEYDDQKLGSLFGDYGFGFSCHNVGAVCVCPRAEHVSAPRGAMLGHVANVPPGHSDLRSMLDSNATIIALGGLVPCVVAVEDIDEGHEITVPYLMGYDSPRMPSELGGFLRDHVRHAPTRARWIARQLSNSVSQRIGSRDSLKAIAGVVAERKTSVTH